MHLGTKHSIESALETQVEQGRRHPCLGFLNAQDPDGPVWWIHDLWRPGVTFRAQVWYTDNKSNVVLNDYERTEASLGVRFNF